MIIEFSLGNFRSFKEIQTLHFQAAKIKSKYPNVDKNNVFSANEKYDLLKSKVIYGANASGKSNLIKGMMAMFKIIEHSFKDEEIIEYLIDPFRLSKDTISEPTFFQICFILDEIPYRYGMQLQNGKVIDEWLFGTPEKREVYFFVREGLDVKVNENQFKEALKIIPTNAEETPIYSETSLFLTVAAASKRLLAEKIFNYFDRNIGIFSGLDDKQMMNIVLNELDDNNFKKKLIELLRAVGMEISSIERLEVNIDDFPSEVKELLNAEKNKLAFIEIKKRMSSPEGLIHDYADFDLNKHEAEGTKKLISFAPFIFSALKKGRIMVIDEFDARLHPRLSRKIIELFNSNETNPKNAQLVIVSHDTNMMDAKLFRRDQISFVEKNEFGASRLYTLVEYKGIRNNSSFEKDYLKGKYGAVPFLNEVDNLFISENIPS